MANFNSIGELIDICAQGKTIPEVAIEYEIELTGKKKNQIIAEMDERVKVMRESAKKGLTRMKSRSGWVGDEAWMLEHSDSGKRLCGTIITRAMVNALAISGLNACRGKIVAAPTAGSCGILPGAVLAVADELKVANRRVVDAMLVAGVIGIVIEKNATFSAAEGGCQAECGTASAMAAASIAYLKKGSIAEIFNAAALALKNSLGLSCDPVASLVEIPCVKRNAFYAAHAIVAAELALSGIKSVISLDGVIEAMSKTAEDMTKALKETSTGGLAATVEGRTLSNELKEQISEAKYQG